MQKAGWWKRHGSAFGLPCYKYMALLAILGPGGLVLILRTGLRPAEGARPCHLPSGNDTKAHNLDRRPKPS